jgi:hypothetical protein
LRTQVVGMRLFGDDQDAFGLDQRSQSVDGLLDERSRTAQRQELLRSAAAAERPQASPLPTGEDGDVGIGWHHYRAPLLKNL